MFGLFRGTLKNLVLMGVVSLFVLALFHDAIAKAFHNDPVFQQSGNLIQQGKQMLGPTNMFFAPDQNLETADIDQLRRARSHIDISMYAFTDRELAVVLKEIAGRGVLVRLYRDQEQFESEKAHAHRGHPDTSEILRGARNIQIRIKGGPIRDLMHQKDYCVDCVSTSGVLREGSANWSVGAERFQDNSIWFTSEPRQVDLFKHKFEEMWNRPSNRIVQ